MRGCERRPPSRRNADGGFVTAETALALPVLVIFTALLVSGLIAVLVQIQCVDAARSGARAAARQDPPDRVREAARGIAPRGATVTVRREESQVRVVVVVKTPFPFDLRAEAVADAEDAAGTRVPGVVDEATKDLADAVEPGREGPADVGASSGGRAPVPGKPASARTAGAGRTEGEGVPEGAVEAASEERTDAGAAGAGEPSGTVSAGRSGT